MELSGSYPDAHPEGIHRQSKCAYLRAMTISTRVAELRAQRVLMIQYLDHKRTIEDWHGVMDAAADIRELDAKIAALEQFRSWKQF